MRNYCWRIFLIGAGAVVNKDVKPFSLMVGVPCKQIGWLSCFGERIELSISGSGEWTCPHTKQKYILKDGEMSITF